jgi:hypothetical protein
MTGQLDIFKGKRQRGVKPPDPLEIAIHGMVADVLNRWLTPGWMWWHTPNGGLRDKATAGMMKRLGAKPGVSDFLLISPGMAQLHALELKRRLHKPTDDQMAFLEAVGAAGGKQAWTDGFDGAIAILKRWGALRVDISLS